MSDTLNKQDCPLETSQQVMQQEGVVVSFLYFIYKYMYIYVYMVSYIKYEYLNHTHNEQ